MTQLYALVAIGTAATLLAIMLFSLRANIEGRKPVLVLMRRWAAMDTRTSGFVLALLCAIAVLSFAGIPTSERSVSSSTSSLPGLPYAQFAKDTSVGSEDRASATPEMESLKAYADEIDAKNASTAAKPPPSSADALPDVDTMIAQLLARLEKQPNDVNGWRMLAWSYLNTNRAQEATQAYETALKLEPGDAEIKKGLEAAKAAQTATIKSPTAELTTGAAAKSTSAAEDPEKSASDSMIRGMVDQLATRLETSPNDENGWLRLMRSRMTLGEKDAAQVALKKALETFASDASATARLTAAARELGVEPNEAIP